jgi:hypothetical protein
MLPPQVLNVYISIGDKGDNADKAQLYNTLSGGVLVISPATLTTALRGSLDDVAPPISRAIEEATVLLFDVSSSMGHEAFVSTYHAVAAEDTIAMAPGKAAGAPPAILRRPSRTSLMTAPPGGDDASGPAMLSRLDGAKQLISLYVNRCTAYDFPQAVGLLAFGAKVPARVEFTDNFTTFQEEVRAPLLRLWVPCAGEDRVSCCYNILRRWMR